MRHAIRAVSYCATFWENETPEKQNPPEGQVVRKSLGCGNPKISAFQSSGVRIKKPLLMLKCPAP
jgi:hypothetical protein